jgi:hypothetical protein
MRNTKINPPVITRQIFDTALKSYTFDKSPSGNCEFVILQLVKGGGIKEVDRFRTNGFEKKATWSWLK